MKRWDTCTTCGITYIRMSTKEHVCPRCRAKELGCIITICPKCEGKGYVVKKDNI